MATKKTLIKGLLRRFGVGGGCCCVAIFLSNSGWALDTAKWQWPMEAWSLDDFSPVALFPPFVSTFTCLVRNNFFCLLPSFLCNLWDIYLLSSLSHKNKTMENEFYLHVNLFFKLKLQSNVSAKKTSDNNGREKLGAEWGKEIGRWISWDRISKSMW